MQQHPIMPADSKPEVPANKTGFSSLMDAYRWANSQLSIPGVVAQTSRIYSDRIRPPRSSHLIKLVGVEKKAEKMAQRLAPGGVWSVEVERPGTEYEAAGILGPKSKTTGHYRFSAWYSKFFVYAYGMMKAEWVHKCMGLDYETINSYYGTCMGFVDMGLGNHNVDGYNRIEPEDVDLFCTIYSASTDIKRPQLPFDEAFAPCSVFVAIRRPDFFTAQWDRDSWMTEHVQKVCEAINQPVPAFKW